jgi:type IV secretion system protein TrbL
LSCNVLHPVGCAASLAKTAAGDAFSSIAHDFAKTAASAVDWLWAQLGQATAIQLSGPGFRLDAGIVTALTTVVAVGLFTLQVTASVLRRDPGGLARAARGLVVAFVAGGAAVAVTAAALAATDQLSSGVVQAATGGTVTQLGQTLLAGKALADATTNPAGLMLLALAALVAVAVVWVALAVRKILIVVSAVFAPLAFAGSLADITVAWTRRWIEITAALIVSKLLLVLIFVVGLGMLVGHLGQAGAGATQTATQVIAGVLVLALAGFAPWMALRIIHFGGDHLGQLHALASTTTHGARTAVAAPQKVAALSSNPAGLSAARTAAPVRPLPTPLTAGAGGPPGPAGGSGSRGKVPPDTAAGPTVGPAPGAPTTPAGDPSVPATRPPGWSAPAGASSGDRPAPSYRPAPNPAATPPTREAPSAVRSAATPTPRSRP